MTFDFGDVLIVEFPFTDGSASKRRPAVVISLAHDFVRSKAGVFAAPDLKELRGLLGRILG